MMPVVQPLQLSFCPIPVQSADITVVRSGKTIGVLVWTYPNGDMIVRTEEGHWLMPKGGMQPDSQVPL